MKKFAAVILALLLTIGIAFAGGDQNCGDVGQGTVDRGDSMAGPGQDRTGR